jgi:hypothetical protein
MGSQMGRLVALVTLAVTLAVAATLALAAPAKQYQFTGTVTEIDAKAKTISVDKGGDVWEFATDGLKDLKLKKGDKVTVHYTMIAKKVESK